MLIESIFAFGLCGLAGLAPVAIVYCNMDPEERMFVRDAQAWFIGFTAYCVILWYI